MTHFESLIPCDSKEHDLNVDWRHCQKSVSSVSQRWISSCVPLISKKWNPNLSHSRVEDLSIYHPKARGSQITDVEMVVEQRPNSNEDLTCLCRIKKPKTPIKCLLSKNDAEWTSIVDFILHFWMDLIQFHFLSPNGLMAILSILRPMSMETFGNLLLEVQTGNQPTHHALSTHADWASEGCWANVLDLSFGWTTLQIPAPWLENEELNNSW